MKTNATKIICVLMTLSILAALASCTKGDTFTATTLNETFTTFMSKEFTTVSETYVVEPSITATSAPEKTTTSAPTTQATTHTDYTSRYTSDERKMFFADAVFIGDSRVEDFVFFNNLPTENCFASSGISVSTVYTKECIEINGKKYTPMDALKKRRSIDRVYIGFGLNEIDWPYQDVFIKDYAKVIADIRAISPDAKIYVMSILPVTHKIEADGVYTNAKVVESNKRIKQMAEDNDVIYADVYSAVVDESGCLPGYAASDGIHMGRKLNLQWCEYLYSIG